MYKNAVSQLFSMEIKSKITGIATKPPQYLAEVMCIRYAQKNGLTIGPKFWNLPAFRLFYKNQLLAAHSLLKVYTFEAIIKAIDRKEYSWVYSLRFKGLTQGIVEEQSKIDAIKTKIEKIETTPVIDNTMAQPRKPTATQSRISKLDE